MEKDSSFEGSGQDPFTRGALSDRVYSHLLAQKETVSQTARIITEAGGNVPQIFESQAAELDLQIADREAMLRGIWDQESRGDIEIFQRHLNILNLEESIAETHAQNSMDPEDSKWPYLVAIFDPEEIGVSFLVHELSIARAELTQYMFSQQGSNLGE